MGINIIIPVMHTIDHLLECLYTLDDSLDSIPSNITTYFPSTYTLNDLKLLNFESDSIELKITSEMGKVPLVNNHLRLEDADITIVLSDNVSVTHGFIPSILEIFDKEGLDSVIGFNVSPNLGGCKTTYCAVGKKFISRFPNRQLLCPDYNNLFADIELDLYANKTKRLFYNPKALVTIQEGSLIDELNLKVNGDITTHRLRKSAGYLWGEDKELIYV